MAARKNTARSNTVENQKAVPASFTKEQILSSELYKSRRDLLSAVLEEGKEYSLEDINKAIEIFMKGRVE